VRRYLVAANQTLGGDHLMERLQALAAGGDCEFHIVVPASADPTQSFHDQASDHALARRRLDEALEKFGTLGVPVTGEVGDHRAVDAILDVLRRERFDEVILSTLPAGASRWLRLDTVSRVERAVEIPVTHIVATDARIGSSGR
jgi:hypothetical protein